MVAKFPGCKRRPRTPLALESEPLYTMLQACYKHCATRQLVSTAQCAQHSELYSSACVTTLADVDAGQVQTLMLRMTLPGAEAEQVQMLVLSDRTGCDYMTARIKLSQTEQADVPVAFTAASATLQSASSGMEATGLPANALSRLPSTS